MLAIAIRVAIYNFRASLERHTSNQRGILKPFVLRRIQVVALLSASGALIGAATAVALTYIATAVAQALTPTGRVWYYFGAGGFAIVGALGTPLLAWLLMRRVPLWRAVAEPAVGGLLGSLAAIVLVPFGAPALLAPLCIFGGIVGAGLRLRQAYRSPRDAQPVDPPAGVRVKLKRSALGSRSDQRRCHCLEYRCASR